MLLLLLCLHMLDDRCHSVNPFLHVLHILHQGVKWRGLFISGILGHVQQSSGVLSEEELKGGLACGCLGCLSDSEEQAGQE